MSQYVKNRDYQELSFPRNWPNDQRVAFINATLSNKTNKSVELLIKGGRIVIRIWLVDHMN